MGKNMVVGDSGHPFGLLEELMKQLKVGRKTGGKKGLTENQLRAVLEHRVSYEAEQISAVLPYADEVVESSYDYAPEYRVRIVAEQVERLAVEFPNLDFSHVEELASGKLPEGAEGWGVIPKQSKVAKSCHGAMDKAIDLLSAQHGKKFKNWRVGALTEKYLRLLEKTEKTLAKLEAETPGDYLVIPFQFGKKWRGKSVRHAQARFAEDEFGLGPYEVAILLLTHPDRITGSNQLNIDCGGCEYRTDVSESAFPFCLDFSWYYDCKRMVLNRFGADYAFELWGSASGFASLCLYFRAKALNKQSFCDII